MKTSRRLSIVAAAVMLAGCGAEQASTAPPARPEPTPRAAMTPAPTAPVAPPPEKAAEAPPKPKAPPPPTEVDRILDGAKAKIGAKDLSGAQKEIDRARTAAGSDPDERFKVDYQQATLHAYRGDFEAAAKVFVTYLKETPHRPDAQTEAWSHNCLMMLRGAQGDILAAMAENDEYTVLGLNSTWSVPDMPREKHVWMKDTWHRAYYLRMAAEKVTGSRKEAALRYAEAARKRYGELAAAHPSYADSIAVLDGYFAALDRDKERALAAAKRVNLKENDDVEDLYLAGIAFEAGGDAAAAEEVRRRIRAAPAYLAVPIVVKFIEADARKDRSRFSPRIPTGAP